MAFGVLTALVLTAARDPEGERVTLPWRAGGKLAFSVDAAAFPDSGGATLEIYVRIPPSTLSEMVRDTAGAGRLRLAARLKSPYGARQHEAVQEFAIDRADTSGGFGKVVMLSFPTRAGRQRLEVRLEDLQSRKRGLLYLGRAREANTVAGVLEVPAPRDGRDLSDLEFVWREGPGRRGGGFQRGGHTVLPNPERLYGLLQSEVVVHFVASARPGDARDWRWVARLLDHEGRGLALRESTGTAPRLLASAAFDISREPAGDYAIEIKAWQEGDTVALVREASFSVAWTREAWLHNPRDVEDDVHFLLDPEQEETFVLLSPGAQERYLDEFWRRRDPSPETAVNEALETFRSRVAHANATYSRAGIGKGMFSDMGRVYIRYGAPGEVHHQVIPTGSETLEQVVRELAATETRAMGDLADKKLGADLRPFEVWIYDAGTGLPPDADPDVPLERKRQRRMVFLFVDEHGLGDFRLRYSTE